LLFYYFKNLYDFLNQLKRFISPADTTLFKKGFTSVLLFSSVDKMA